MPCRAHVWEPKLGLCTASITSPRASISIRENTSYVLPGDFHHIVFPTNSVEVVYTNVMDDVFDLNRFMAEATRVLKPGGIFIIDADGYDEGFVPGEFEALYWRNKDTLIDRIEKIGGLLRIETRDLGKLRKECWTQVVFRLPE